MANPLQAFIHLLFTVVIFVLLSACGGGSEGSSSSTSDQASSQSSSASNSSLSDSSSSTSSSTPSEPQPIPPAVTQAVVRFVYFIESDQSYDPAVHQALIEQAYAMQLFWYEQFGGTFYLYDQVVDVMHAEHPAQWYVSTEDGVHNLERWYRLGNIKNELYRRLGIRNFDPKVRVVNYPVARFDGRVGGNFGGAWMDGDDLSCLIGENGGYNFPYDERNPAHCMGHVAHEFGHVFGLDHTGPNTDCMQYGFYIGTVSGLCEFSQSNRQIVIDSPANEGFLDALPGEVVMSNGEVVAR